jgi:hypothetical protein
MARKPYTEQETSAPKSHASKGGKGAPEQKPKKQYDFYLTDVPEKGQESNMFGAFTVHGGTYTTQKGETKPYLNLMGFSKELNSPIKITFAHNIDKLMAAMDQAGFLSSAGADTGVDIEDESE